MRFVFVGGGILSVNAARLLLKRNHELILIEQSKERIDALAEILDCGFIHGDGSKPAILREASPENTDILFCLTDDDQTNILASLVGRSLGFKRIVTRIEDPEYEHICVELGLEDAINPDRTIGRFLADMAEGQDPLELSAMIRDEARVFSFIIREEEAGALAELALPERCNVVCVYRDDELIFPHGDDKLKAKDEVVVVVHRQELPALLERWTALPHATGNHLQDMKSITAEEKSVAKPD